MEVTTLDSSRQVQRRDLELFVRFFEEETKGTAIDNWTPRLSQAFLNSLRGTVKQGGARQLNDRTINRILAHLKTFSKWVEKVRPFALGDPMEKIRTIAATSLLAIERALTPTERRRILDAADLLPKTGGRSKDRNRFKGEERPVRKGFRPYRNRAVVYALIEKGMRRAAVAGLLLENVDFQEKRLTVVEKGAVTHTYKISSAGIAPILDYVKNERGPDAEHFGAPALFLAAASSRNQQGRLFGFHRLRVLTVTSSAERVASLVSACSQLKRGHGLFLFADPTILEKPDTLLSSPWQTGKQGETSSLLD